MTLSEMCLVHVVQVVRHKNTLPVTCLFCGVQVVGHKKGLDVMERADPLFLLMGLPTIPVMLVLGKMIRWEDYVVRMWQRHSAKLNGIVPGKVSPIPPLFHILPS